MERTKTSSLSPFGQQALELDHHFSELERLGGQIERLAIDSESGLELGLRLLAQFTEHGKSITEGMKAFAEALESCRQRSENAARIVGEQALIMQARKEEQNRVEERFGLLGSKVQKVNSLLATFQESTEKSHLAEHLASMDSTLAEFVNEALEIREEARKSNLKSVERDAESLHGTLQSVRGKINSVVPIVH